MVIWTFVKYISIGTEVDYYVFIIMLQADIIKMETLN